MKSKDFYLDKAFGKKISRILAARVKENRLTAA
nr:MAG TPA: hypothetical protein [Caudoviricetes sp.]